MGIFDRLTRMIRAEYNEAKRVIKDRDEDPETLRRRKEEELEQARRDLARAEDELARARKAEADYEARGGAEAWAAGRGRERDANEGASHWADPRDAGQRPLNEGAAAWARSGDESAARDTAGDTDHDAYSGTLYPRAIREAYAALELPMGSGREQIQTAHRELLARYHPDRHQGDERRLATANELTRRINDARDALIGWLDTRGL